MLGQVLAVAVGGAVGAVARYLVSRGASVLLGDGFPYGTLIVNVVGSLLLGVIAGLSVGRLGVPPLVKLSVGVGFCGAFTTFSTFAVDTLGQASWGTGLLNVALNNGLAITAAATGFYLGASIRSPAP